MQSWCQSYKTQETVKLQKNGILCSNLDCLFVEMKNISMRWKRTNLIIIVKLKKTFCKFYRIGLKFASYLAMDCKKHQIFFCTNLSFCQNWNYIIVLNVVFVHAIIGVKAKRLWFFTVPFATCLCSKLILLVTTERFTGLGKLNFQF